MLSKLTTQFVKTRSLVATRSFGAMNELNRELFEHKFTTEMNFRSSFEKMKCFRVMDEEGKIINPGYDTKIPDAEILKMYDAMVTINEAD
jgi:hypothetical protein